MDIIAIAWIIFAASLLAILLVSYIFVKYYSDKHESEALPTFVTTISLAVVLCSVFMVPLDIYVVSSAVDAKGELLISAAQLAMRTRVVEVIYYVLFGVILLLSFVLIPFTYFYYEEKDTEITAGQRICAAMKYTTFLIVIIIVLFVVGIFVKGNPNEHNGTSTSTYIRNLLKENVSRANTLVGLERSLSFAIACVAIIGYLGWCTFTAFGFSALPIGMMKGRKKVEQERDEIKSDIEQTRKRRQNISSKYLGGGRHVTQEDAAHIALLSDREKVNELRAQQLGTVTNSCWFVFCKLLKPFSIAFGILFGLISLLLLTAIVLTQIDRLANSYCGASCGFLLKYSNIYNPVDKALVFLSKYYPLDYVAFTAMVVYFFFTTLAGIVSMGVRILCVKLYAIEHRRSPPQGLLLATVILMFSLIAMNFELITLSPQYAQFGSQHYTDVNGTHPCQPSAVTNLTNCHMTQIGQIVNRASLKVGVFGEIFYWAGWLFVGVWLIGLIVCIIRKRQSVTQTSEYDSDYED